MLVALAQMQPLLRIKQPFVMAALSALQIKQLEVGILIIGYLVMMLLQHRQVLHTPTMYLKEPVRLLLR